ncbi:DUF4360 domain-containing protein [Actinomadura chibensis]|uniref:DUF4360 domain-containing protein n=1 Tax=Actinomadura chibensis TaxID=392828 RepID=A0A5D0NVV6_9ACTN|nr:DUF4360 domain-containing protein [Actinomadura chibensis]TYB48141.1 DUF4360 domain-containing protein [Actinomadura chibensis]
MNHTALAALRAAALALPALPALASAPPAAADPPPGGATVEIATVNGSGCPRGTAAVAVFNDGDDFRVSITTEPARAEAGGASAPADSRKPCQVNLKVHVPQGYTYAVRQTDYSGDAHLEPGASATLSSSAYLQGTTPPKPATRTLRGPYSGPWRFEISESEPVFSPCGEQRNQNFGAELRVDMGDSDPAKTNFIETDGKTVYHFAWKRCPTSM